MTSPSSSPTARRRGTTKSQGRKHALDKFYTDPQVAAACLERLDLSRFRRIVEPSAGNGSFCTQLPRRDGLTVVALDLAPEHPEVSRQDFFTYRDTTPSPTLVVGNPPFGQQCALALRFINHAFEAVAADTVAFVLPRSFRKASIQSRVFPFARLADEWALPRNSFVLDGAPYDLPAVFQRWERTTSRRPTDSRPLHSRFFTFTTRSDPHDFAVRRVGGRAGHAFVDSASASPQSNYFLRLTDRDLDPAEVAAWVNTLVFPGADDGTGPRTLSKRELVEGFDAGFPRRFPSR